MKEIWKTINEFDNYSVSNLGKVKNNKTDTILSGVYSKGYLTVKLYKNGKYKRKKIHRLVLEYFEGKSELVVDHINGIKDDNRLVNLRYCSQKENILNYTKNFLNTSSKYSGVYFNRKSGKWVARIRINGKRKYLGSFNSEELAHKEYLSAKQRGESPAYSEADFHNVAYRPY